METGRKHSCVGVFSIDSHEDGIWFYPVISVIRLTKKSSTDFMKPKDVASMKNSNLFVVRLYNIILIEL